MRSLLAAFPPQKKKLNSDYCLMTVFPYWLLSGQQTLPFTFSYRFLCLS